MTRDLPYIAAVIVLGIFCAGCGNEGADLTSAVAAEPAGFPDVIAEEWPRSEDSVLVQGRAVWIENCENCHGIGKAESPRFGDYDAWASRLVKGEDVLVSSAINGFEGKSEGGMPARGGEEDLTDEEVTAAARYMIHFSRKP